MPTIAYYANKISDEGAQHAKASSMIQLAYAKQKGTEGLTMDKLKVVGSDLGIAWAHFKKLFVITTSTEVIEFLRAELKTIKFTTPQNVTYELTLTEYSPSTEGKTKDTIYKAMIMIPAGTKETSTKDGDDEKYTTLIVEKAAEQAKGVGLIKTRHSRARNNGLPINKIYIDFDLMVGSRLDSRDPWFALLNFKMPDTGTPIHLMFRDVDTPEGGKYNPVRDLRLCYKCGYMTPCSCAKSSGKRGAGSSHDDALTAMLAGF